MKKVNKPAHVTALEAVYGLPSQEGFGSAVFAAQMGPEEDLEEMAQYYYREFVGDLWEEWGEETWMGPWKEVYARGEGAAGIAAELRSIADREASASVPMILDAVENAVEGQKVLAAAFDAPEVQEVRVYHIGDGEAMSGLIVAGKRSDGEALFLTFLLD